MTQSKRFSGKRTGKVAHTTATAVMLAFPLAAAALLSPVPAHADGFLQKALNHGLSRDQYVQGWARACGPVTCPPPPGCSVQSYSDQSGQQGPVYICHKDNPPPPDQQGYGGNNGYQNNYPGDQSPGYYVPPSQQPPYYTPAAPTCYSPTVAQQAAGVPPGMCAVGTVQLGQPLPPQWPTGHGYILQQSSGVGLAFVQAPYLAGYLQYTPQ